MHSIGNMSQWAYNIRKLGYPFASETEYQLAITNLKKSKTNINSIDELFENIDNHLVFEDNICKYVHQNDKLPWKSVTNKFRSGKIKLAFSSIGMYASNITNEDEELLQSYLKLIVPEYYMFLYRQTLITAYEMYPELQFIPISSKHLENMLGSNAKHMIDIGIKKMQEINPNSSTINGLYAKLSKDQDKTMFVRLFESLQHLPGCYYATNDGSSLKSCKIESRSCNNIIDSENVCEENDRDTSNIYTLMSYLLEKTKENDKS